MNSPAESENTPDEKDPLLQLILALDDCSDDTSKNELIKTFRIHHPDRIAELDELLSTVRDLSLNYPEIARHQLLVSGQVLGPFHIRRLIAIGGMGEIYEAEDTILRRLVAVKVIRQGRSTPATHDRFIEEQLTLARLHHTNIVPVYASGQQCGIQYFAMPYLHGKTLAQVIRAACEIAAGNPARQLPSVFEIAGDSLQEPLPVRAFRPLLSKKYLRSAVESLIQAAEGLEHAHREKIYHLDLKPSNLMIVPARRTSNGLPELRQSNHSNPSEQLLGRGQCWVIDFGYGFTPSYGAPELFLGELKPNKQPSGNDPEYLAPELRPVAPCPQTDVWGLGAILHELLTLQPASRKCTKPEATSQSRAPVRRAPGDLLAISRKAMSTEIDKRYASAAEFADDLKSWLTLRPTLAHPDRVFRPLLLWAARNWIWALPVILFICTIIIITKTQLNLNSFRAKVAEDQRHQAEEQEHSAEQRERELKRELLIQRMQRVRFSQRSDGWSRENWELATKASAISVEGVQGEAAMSLSGLDAHQVHYIDTRDSGGIAINRKGDRIVMAGWSDQPARVWSPGIAQPEERGPTGIGPVTFREDDTAIRLVASSACDPKLRLWDLTRNTLLHEWSVPGLQLKDSTTIVLADNGAAAAAVLGNERGDPTKVLVWDLRSFCVLKELPLAATAIALSPDACYLATGTEDGTVEVFPVGSGSGVTLRSAATRVHSITFGRSPTCKHETDFQQNWLLAAGHEGGGVTIWDLASRVVISRPFGGRDITNAMSFSPDGSTIATTGRYPLRLWDVRSGRLLLEINRRNSGYYTGVAFSSDGRRIATSIVAMHGFPGGTELWELEWDRGIKELVGLSGPIAQLRFSRDGRRVAALSYNWDAAVWDIRQNRLLFRARAPQGRYPNDHAAIAFNHTATRLAAGAGTQVRVWDVERGCMLRTYHLPKGLGDSLAFRDSNQLLSVRCETPAGDRYPERDVAPPTLFPRVIRGRELTESGEIRLLYELKELSQFMHAIELAPDASFCVVDGRRSAGEDGSFLLGFDPLSGNNRWEIRLRKRPYRQFVIDCQGTLLFVVPFELASAPQVHSIDPLTGRVLDPTLRPMHVVARHGELSVRPHYPSLKGIEVLGRDGVPLLHLGQDLLDVTPYRFDYEANQVAWGCTDGTVMVGDLIELRRRLSTIGLGW